MNQPIQRTAGHITAALSEFRKSTAPNYQRLEALRFTLNRAFGDLTIIHKSNDKDFLKTTQALADVLQALIDDITRVQDRLAAAQEVK